MSVGMPGTWLAREDLRPGDEPPSADGRCDCRVPLIWDTRRDRWRHLADGTACLPARQGGGPVR